MSGAEWTADERAAPVRPCGDERGRLSLSADLERARAELAAEADRLSARVAEVEREQAHPLLLHADALRKRAQRMRARTAHERGVAEGLRQAANAAVAMAEGLGR